MLRLNAQDKSSREIAEELVLAGMTTRTHACNILGTLHLPAVHKRRSGPSSKAWLPSTRCRPTWDRQREPLSLPQMQYALDARGVGKDRPQGGPFLWAPNPAF